MRPIRLVSQQHLHAVPRRTFNNRLVFTRKPVIAVPNFSNVATTPQNRVYRTAWESRRRGTIADAFFCQSIDQLIDRERFKGVKVEDSLDRSSIVRLYLDDTQAILADIAKSVWRRADKPALLDAAGVALTDIA